MGSITMAAVHAIIMDDQRSKGLAEFADTLVWKQAVFQNTAHSVTLSAALGSANESRPRSVGIQQDRVNLLVGPWVVQSIDILDNLSATSSAEFKNGM